MTNKFFYIFFFLILFQFDLNVQTFEIDIDKFNLNIKSISLPATKIYLTHTVKFKEKCLRFFVSTNVVTPILSLTEKNTLKLALFSDEMNVYNYHFFFQW